MRMNVCMGLVITNMSDLQLSKASSMYSSGSTTIALCTTARTLWESGTGVGWIVRCTGGFALEGWETLGWTGSLACFVDCELPLASVARVLGWMRRLSWHPADVDFRDALDRRPCRVARGLLLGCPAVNGSIAAGCGTVFCEIDGACACGTCSCCGGRLACNTSATLDHQSSSIWLGSVGANVASFSLEERSVLELVGMLTGWSLSVGQCNIGECWVWEFGTSALLGGGLSGELDLTPLLAFSLLAQI